MPTLLRRIAAIDSRSLALFRVLFGLVVLIDFASRIPWAATFYSSEGVLSAESAVSLGEFLPRLLPASLDAPWVAVGVCAAGVVAAVGLVAGYKTRIATLVCLLGQLYLLSRNPLVQGGADRVIVMFLFWSLWLPLGATYGVDARRAKDKLDATPVNANRPVAYVSLATFAALLQLAVIYVCTAVAKSGETWRDGTALYYALQMDQHLLPIGRIVREWSLETLKWLTWLTLAIEYVCSAE